jgi:hypothetical protein
MLQRQLGGRLLLGVGSRLARHRLGKPIEERGLLLAQHGALEPGQHRPDQTREQVLQNLLTTPVHLPLLVGNVGGQMGRSLLLGNKAADCLAKPPDRMRAQAQAPAGVELVVSATPCTHYHVPIAEVPV